MGKFVNFYKLFIFISFFIIAPNYSSFAQVFDQRVADYITKVEHPYNFLQRIERLGVKEPGEKGLDSTYFWLKKQIENLGYVSITQNFLYDKDTLRNIVFTKKGDIDSCIVVGAHYDSKVGPGVNDNGTGVFGLYQLAKLLKNVSTHYSIAFIYFSGEEIDYLGSRYFVKMLNKDSIKIKFMFNLDQLGGTIDEDNSGVKCERDEISNLKNESTVLATSMAKIYSLYTNLNPIITSAYLSDYLSFRDSGYIISGVYQYSSFPYYHTQSDLLKYIEFNSLMSVVKGALAYMLYFSVADVPANIANPNTDKKPINVYFTANTINIRCDTDYEIFLYDELGRMLSYKKNKSNEQSLDVSALKPGIYFVWVKTKSQSIYNKFFVHP